MYQIYIFFTLFLLSVFFKTPYFLVVFVWDILIAKVGEDNSVNYNIDGLIYYGFVTTIVMIILHPINYSFGYWMALFPDYKNNDKLEEIYGSILDFFLLLSGRDFLVGV